MGKHLGVHTSVADVGKQPRSLSLPHSRSFFYSPPPHDQQEKTQGSWMPQWMKSRLPGMLGGNREEISEMEGMTFDSYMSSLKMARRLGGLTGNAFGTSNASDPAAQGTLLLYEKIYGAMLQEERSDPESAFNMTRRKEVAQQVGCSLDQVDNCIARFLWTKTMMTKLAQHRKQGKPMPTTIEEMERIVGTWQSYKSTAPQGMPSSSSTAGKIRIPPDAIHWKDGQPCGLAGLTVGRSTKCPVKKKSYKACCGKFETRKQS